MLVAFHTNTQKKSVKCASLDIIRKARKQEPNKEATFAYAHQMNMETEQDGEMQGYDPPTNVSIKQRNKIKKLFFVPIKNHKKRGTERKKRYKSTRNREATNQGGKGSSKEPEGRTRWGARPRR